MPACVGFGVGVWLIEIESLLAGPDEHTRRTHPNTQQRFLDERSSQRSNARQQNPKPTHNQPSTFHFSQVTTFRSIPTRPKTGAKDGLGQPERLCSRRGLLVVRRTVSETERGVLWLGLGFVMEDGYDIRSKRVDRPP